MRRALLLSIALLCANAALAAPGIDPKAMNGWTIVVANDAIPSEQFAAEEFKTLFKQATGIDLAVAAAPPAKKHNIFIGPGAVSLAPWHAFGVDKLGEEGLRIRVARNNLLIAGGRPRGTLYGVYEFFERCLGARYLTCDHTHFPETAALPALKPDHYTYTPQFSFRWSYYKENSDRPDFAARLRTNTVQSEEKLGGRTQQSLINHSLHRWVNPALFGQSHPEYFALVNGERKLDVGGGGPEPCVTNPEVIEIVAEGVIKDLDANPHQQNISVSQNDNDEYCRCPRCEEVTKREGTPMGPHLALVNAVAERVEKKHPNVKIGTLAYWYTRKPPKTIVPRKNIQIQLCSIECCTLHAIDDPACAKNRAFCEDMRNWKKICNDIWVWNYNTDFACYDLPFPNLRGIGANVRFFQQNNVKGVFMQANGNGNTGEISDLRNYVISQCLWHPGQDSWPRVEEFCRLHYQESAQPILDYLTMLHDNAHALGKHPNCFPSAEQVGLTPEIAARALGYFENALALAKSDAVRARVEKASICAYKAMILSGAGAWACQDGVCRRQWPDGRSGHVYERYAALARTYGMSMVNEGSPAAPYLEEMERLNAVPAVSLENDVWRLIVLPGENGRLAELLHKPSGRHFVAGMTHDDISNGTHEEEGLQGYNDAKPAAFTAKLDGTVLSLSKALEDGSVIERSIALKPDAPSKIFFSSKITHKGPAAKTYQFKSHPEFDPGSNSANCEIISAYAKDSAWTRFNREWKRDEGPDAELLNKAKGGAFAFFNHEAHFGLSVNYDPVQVDHPYLWWRPDLEQINLELITPAVELQPGGSMKLDYAFELLAEPPK